MRSSRSKRSVTGLATDSLLIAGKPNGANLEDRFIGESEPMKLNATGNIEESGDLAMERWTCTCAYVEGILEPLFPILRAR